MKIVPLSTELIDCPLSKPHNQLPSNTADLLDVVLARSLVWSSEEARRVLAEPLGQLVEFFAEAVDGLLVHVCLGDEFGEGDCHKLSTLRWDWVRHALY